MRGHPGFLGSQESYEGLEKQAEEQAQHQRQDYVESQQADVLIAEVIVT